MSGARKTIYLTSHEVDATRGDDVGGQDRRNIPGLAHGAPLLRPLRLAQKSRPEHLAPAIGTRFKLMSGRPQRVEAVRPRSRAVWALRGMSQEGGKRASMGRLGKDRSPR